MFACSLQVVLFVREHFYKFSLSFTRVLLPLFNCSNVPCALTLVTKAAVYSCRHTVAYSTIIVGIYIHVVRSVVVVEISSGHSWHTTANQEASFKVTT